jgi:hypothetical protein
MVDIINALAAPIARAVVHLDMVSLHAMISSVFYSLDKGISGLFALIFINNARVT